MRLVRLPCSGGELVFDELIEGAVGERLAVVENLLVEGHVVGLALVDDLLGRRGLKLGNEGLDGLPVEVS